jgi:hypothetical protein
MNPISSLRQWLYPKEFRIGAVTWPPELPVALEQLVSKISAPAQPSQDAVQIGILADVGTGLWRLRQKILQPGSEQPLEEMRRAYRHLESTLDALGRANIRIQDHTGDLIPEGEGLKLKVLAYQPQAGVIHKQVQETIKPTIYYKDQMIQMGEVIVSVPEDSSSHEQNHD